MEICTTQPAQLAESLIAQVQFNFEDLSSEKIGLVRFKFMQDFVFEFEQNSILESILEYHQNLLQKIFCDG